MDATELDENWRRACRTDPGLNRFAQPALSTQLVEAVLNRVQGLGHPPDAVLKGLAAGFAMSNWEATPEAAYLQLATLVFEATKSPNPDLREALHVLQIVGDASISNLLEVWRTEAEEDRLTRLGNRRRMESATRELISATVPFAYVSIDVDGLKVVNDRDGHDAGDVLLKTVAAHIRNSLPAGFSQAFRYGGDEFGVVVRLDSEPPYDVEAAMKTTIATLPAGLSFSYGVGNWPVEDSDFHTVAQHADQRMYAQKQSKKKPKFNRDLRRKAQPKPHPRNFVAKRIQPPHEA